MISTNIEQTDEWEALLQLADPEFRQERWVELGRQLYRIEKASRGLGTFRGICEALGLAGRTGYDMARIVRKLDRLGVEPPSELGWTKLKDVCDLLTFENYEEIFEECLTKTKKELAEYMFKEIQDRIPL